MNILVALDYTQNQDMVLDKGVQFAKMMNGASLTLLHVFSFMNWHRSTGIEDITHIPTNKISNDDFETWCQAARASEKHLQAIVDNIQTLGIHAEGQHLWGQPGPVICAAAQRCQADVIIIGRRATIQNSERALGSVSNFVVHHAPCSVWIVQSESS